jgi:hypothetical protein
VLQVAQADANTEICGLKDGQVLALDLVQEIKTNQEASKVEISKLSEAFAGIAVAKQCEVASDT